MAYSSGARYRNRDNGDIPEVPLSLLDPNGGQDQNSFNFNGEPYSQPDPYSTTMSPIPIPSGDGGNNGIAPLAKSAPDVSARSLDQLAQNGGYNRPQPRNFTAPPPSSQPAPMIPPPPAQQPQEEPPPVTVPQAQPTDATGAPVIAGPQGVQSPQKSAAAQREEDVTQQVMEHHKQMPQAPTGNWESRLGMALLSMTKLRGAAQQIIHPKYTEQMNRYENEEADLQQQQKEATSALSAEGLEANRQAQAQQRLNLGQSYAENERIREAKIAEDAKKADDAAKEKTLRDHEAAIKQMSHGREEDVAYMDAGDPNVQQLKAENWSIVPDTDPSRVVAIPPPFVTVTPEILKYAPTAQPGSLMPWSEYKAARANAAKQQQDAAKPTKPTEPKTVLDYERIMADPKADPALKAEAQAVLKEEKDRVAAGRAQINNNASAPWTPQQAAAAGTPLAPGQRNETFLATLPKDQQLLVKKISDYDYPMPTGGFAMRDPQWKAAITNTLAYDPGFSAQEYQARAKKRSDFKAGVTSKNIRSLNTLTGHIATLEGLGNALDNNPIQAVNVMSNWLSTQAGHPEVTNFETAKNAVATELSSALKGTATEADIKSWSDQIKNAQSPRQLLDATKTRLDLMYRRYAELQDDYQRNMGGQAFPLLSPDASRTLRSHGFDPGKVDPRFASNTDSSPAQGGPANDPGRLRDFLPNKK